MSAELAVAARPRLDGIDLVRGLVIVLMALDHTKDFVQSPADLGRALDVGNTTPALYFTRWVTHFCAPVFVFLAGVSAHFGLKRGRGPLAVFLLTRGLWLAVLELTLVHCLWFINFQYEFVPLQVIWAIGTSMMLLSAFVWLPPVAVGVIGLSVIAQHNMLDPIKAADITRVTGSQTLGAAWAVVHSTEWVWFVSAPDTTIVPAYAILPWFGVMAAGYGAGAIWQQPPVRRRATLLSLGAWTILEFVAIRYANSYGDPRPWRSWPSGVETLMSFLNCEKYPPSLDYCLMTLGPALVALAVFDRWNGGVGRTLVTFGRVPLFFYLVHLPAIQLLAAGVMAIGIWIGTYESLAVVRKQGLGWGLPGVYLAWAGVVFVLYWPCRWYAKVKSRSGSAWLSYL